MIDSGVPRLPRPVPPATAFAALTLVLAVLIGFGGHILAPGASWQVVLPPVLFMAFMAVAASRMRTGYPHPSLGSCNAVTETRAAITAILFVPILLPEIAAASAPGIVALAAVALALDGVDGWLARRAGLVSAFGARFDMEVDSALAAVLAGLLLTQGPDLLFAVSLMVLGFARYAFVLTGKAIPWLLAPLPERPSRKAICVAQIGVLIVVLAIEPLAWLLPMVAGAVIWSFGADIVWLARRRAA